MKKEFIPCKLCEEGYIKGVDDEGIDTITPCDCLAQYRKEIKQQIEYRKANIPEKVWNYSFNDYVGKDTEGNISKLKKFVEKFEDKYSKVHLTFTGVYGTQKSHLARYLCKCVIDKGLTAHYTLADTLLKDLVELKEENKTIDIDSVLNADLLVLDEISEDKVLVYNSGYQLSFLTSFLKQRLEQVNKTTIFITNNDINSKAFGDKFGRTIQDLISREVKDTLVFKDNYEALSKDFDIDDLWS